MKKSVLKIASLTALCLFNLTVLYTACLAWFSAARQNNANNIEIAISSPELNLEYTLYKYDQNYEVIASNRPEDLILNQYDCFIPEKNIYNALLIKFDINGSRISEANTDLFINIDCSETNYNTHYISNITEYSIAPLYIDSTDTETIYNTALEYLTDTDTFVTETIKNTKLTKSIDLSTCTDLIHNNVISVYIKIDYSRELISRNFSDIEVSTEQAGGTIDFENDITTIGIE